MSEIVLTVAKLAVIPLVISLIIIRLVKLKAAQKSETHFKFQHGTISKEQEQYLESRAGGLPKKENIQPPGFFSPSFLLLLGVLSFIAGSMGGCWISIQMQLTGEEGLGKMIVLTFVGGIAGFIGVPITMYLGIQAINRIFASR